MNTFQASYEPPEECHNEEHAGVALPKHLDEEAIERTARLFRALGDPGRLKVLLCLSRGEACVSELTEALGEGMSTISQRLKLLHGEGFVRRRREGKHIYYSFTDAHISELLAGALEHAEELRNDQIDR